MKGKERMLCAMRRGVPDRVPVMPQIQLAHASVVSGIPPVDIIERPEMGFRAMLETARQYGVDGFRVFLKFRPRRVLHEDGVLFEVDPATGEKVGVIDLAGGWNTIPLGSRRYVQDLGEVARIPVPSADSYWDESADGRCAQMEPIVREAADDYLVVGRPLGFNMNWLLQRRGPQQGLMDLYDEPRLVHALLEKGLEIALQQTRAMGRASIEVFYAGDASASSDVISPRHFREYVFPYYREYCSEVHRLGGLVYIHVCGNQTPLAEMLADTGADCIEPMDPLGGVDAADMKRRVGNRVALMGGVSTLTLLRGTPAEVRAESRECIRAAGRDGGYILAAGCMVPTPTTQENVRAMVRAAHEFGEYPLRE